VILAAFSSFRRRINWRKNRFLVEFSCCFSSYERRGQRAQFEIEKLKRRRAKRAIHGGAKNAPPRGSLRSFAAQKTLAQDDNFKLGSTGHSSDRGLHRLWCGVYEGDHREFVRFFRRAFSPSRGRERAKRYSQEVCRSSKNRVTHWRARHPKFDTFFPAEPLAINRVWIF